MKERKKEKNSAKGITPVKPSARDNTSGGRCNAANPALIPATIPCAAASSYPVVPNTKSYEDKTSSRATEKFIPLIWPARKRPWRW